MTNDLSQLDVFYGELTVAAAHVYARLPRLAEETGLTLRGQVRGPRCLHAQTLPVSVPLVDLGPGPTLLARAVVPDPSFWSADLPAIYDVTVSLMRGETVIGSARRELGLRWLGIRSDHFVQAGKRWVMRGVSARSSMAELPREWHKAGAAYVSAQLELDCLSETSEWGALAAVEVSGGPAEIMERLREISKFPGAGMAIVRGELPFDFKRSQVAPNLLLAQAVRVEEMVLPPWAQFLWAEFDDEAVLSRLLSANAPVVAVRYLTGPRPLDQARAACDQLQRDLAGIGQFAGYVV